MPRTDRLILYPALAAALALSAYAAFRQAPAPHRPITWLTEPASFPGADPDPATVAVCDVYRVIDKLVETDKFQPARKAEEERVNSALKPLADEIQALENELRGADPKDEAAQAKFRTYQEKRQQFDQQRAQLEREYRTFMSKQFIEAYTMARASADGVAESLGYDYVIACRGLDEEITSDDPARIIEAVLARPIIKHPKDADITDDVMSDLKLD